MRCEIMRMERKNIHGDGIHDDTREIQALLDTGLSCVHLPPPKKEYLISSPLRIHSRQCLRLDPATRIRLAPLQGQVYSAILTNADREAGNEYISVIGGIWDMDCMRQPPNPVNSGMYAKPQKGQPLPEFDDKYVRAIMHFFNVRNLVLRDLVLRNAPFHHLRLGMLSHFTIDNITIDTLHAPVADICVDGIGFYDGHCRWGTISNVRGTTPDDLISFNPDCGSLSSRRGPIEDIFIHDIHIDNAKAGIRLLSSGSLFRNITITNVHACTNGAVLQLSNFKTFVNFYPDDKHGYFDNIRLENVTLACSDEAGSAAPPGSRSMIWVESGGIVSNFHLRNICRMETKRATELIHVDRGAEVEWLDIDGVFYANKTGQILPLATNAGHIRHLSLRNIHLSAPEGVFGSALINTGKIDDCRIGDIHAECTNRNPVYHQTVDLPPDADIENLTVDFPAHWHGFRHVETVRLIEDDSSGGQPAMIIKNQSDPCPFSIGLYLPDKSGETLAELSAVKADLKLDGAYQWVDCGEQMLFNAAKRFSLCFGNQVSPRKQDGLTLSNEVEFSIPPFCYLYLPGLYRIWAKVRTEKQADGKYSFYLQRVAFVRRPLRVRGDLSLSGDWFVFTPFDFEDEVPGVDDLRRVPDVLRIGRKEATLKKINVADGVVDFACFWGKTYEQRVGYVYIPFQVDKAGEQTFGFGADWWHQAWLDGNPFNDTLTTGNAFPGFSCTNHLATKHLKAGDHLLVVRFISGKNSSVLCVGGPAEVRAQDSSSTRTES